MYETVAADPVGDASTIGPLVDPDIILLTARYDDVVGRFDASVKFDVAGGQDLLEHPFVARCSDRFDIELLVLVFMSQGSCGSAQSDPGSAPFSADGSASEAPLFAPTGLPEPATISGLTSSVRLRTNVSSAFVAVTRTQNRAT